MRVKIEKLDHFGRGIVWHDGKICFVPDALPDEVVDIEIILKKKKYMIGKINKYIETSNDRIIPKCKYYSSCGGCSLMHLNYDKENEFKYQKVCELVSKFTNYDSSVVQECVFDNELYYRNKIVLHSDKNKLGLYEENSNELVPIDECLLVNKKINKIINYLEKFYDDSKISKVMIRTGNKTDEVMLSIDGDIKDSTSLLELVDVLVINDKVITKNDRITSIIGDKKYLVSSKSFFQVNTYITKKMYDLVYDIVKEKQSKNVLDLYCGTGTIGIYVSDLVDNVLGIEVVKEAIMDANVNKKLNKCDNVSFMVGKVENIIHTIRKKFDTIIVDPPRNGLDSKVIDSILKIKPDTLIYVSCDPTTLMRDINLLGDKYVVDYIKPFNMFPRTYHVECVCVLKLK